MMTLKKVLLQGLLTPVLLKQWGSVNGDTSLKQLRDAAFIRQARFFVFLSLLVSFFSLLCYLLLAWTHFSPNTSLEKLERCFWSQMLVCLVSSVAFMIFHVSYVEHYKSIDKRLIKDVTELWSVWHEESNGRHRVKIVPFWDLTLDELQAGAKDQLVFYAYSVWKNEAEAKKHGLTTAERKQTEKACNKDRTNFERAFRIFMVFNLVKADRGIYYALGKEKIKYDGIIVE